MWQHSSSRQGKTCGLSVYCASWPVCSARGARSQGGVVSWGGAACACRQACAARHAPQQPQAALTTRRSRSWPSTWRSRRPRPPRAAAARSAAHRPGGHPRPSRFRLPQRSRRALQQQAMLGQLAAKGTSLGLGLVLGLGWGWGWGWKAPARWERATGTTQMVPMEGRQPAVVGMWGWVLARGWWGRKAMALQLAPV